MFVLSTTPTLETSIWDYTLVLVLLKVIILLQDVFVSCLIINIRYCFTVQYLLCYSNCVQEKFNFLVTHFQRQGFVRCFYLSQKLLWQLGLLNQIIIIYSAGFFTAVASIAMAMVGVAASFELHKHLLENILKNPMSFFETTPLGRIINRFSSDIADIDLVIPFTCRSLVNCVILLVLTIAIVGYTTPWCLLPAVLLAAIYVIIQVGHQSCCCCHR